MLAEWLGVVQEALLVAAQYKGKVQSAVEGWSRWQRLCVPLQIAVETTKKKKKATEAGHLTARG